MKQSFRLYRRNGVYYCDDNATGKQESLHTDDKVEAGRILNAKNEAAQMGMVNMQIARAYMAASDPLLAKRTWRDVIRAIIEEKTKHTRERWETVEKDQALSPLWKLPLVQTWSDQLMKALNDGTVSTNVFLRRMHNYAVGMGWLPWPILPKKQWPKVVYAEKRSVTQDEHSRIIAREKNLERRDYYELLWQLGGSQTDVASLHAEDVDWKDRTVFYRRKKNAKEALQRFGPKTAAVLARRPKSGPLFPYLITIREKYRATEFKQRCQGLDIEGITLHSYRYSWAERAATCGYPERHAQSGLGHGSKAVARAYAKKAKVIIPPLEDYEAAHEKAAGKVIPMPQEVDVETQHVRAAE
ncbi:MAG: tyrosine-type recombinase/integrase [Verrucomicrobiota bacterium]|jgi:integrase